MGDSVFSGLALTQLAPIAAAYLFGIATGWLIWGGRRGVSNEDSTAARIDEAQNNPARAEAAPQTPAPIADTAAPAAIVAPPLGKLSAIEEEIRKANELLGAQEEEAEAFSEELASLDQAVKRANGRLKLVIRAVQRAVNDR